jgi:Flp pilus assembly protein TadG
MTSLRKLWRDKRGNVLAIAAAALPLVIGSAGLASDTIQWALWKRQLQRAADSAAIAGVYDRITNDGASGNVGTAVANDLAQNNHTIPDLLAAYPTVGFPADTSSYTIPVQVTLGVQRKLGFSSLFLSSPPLITATAIAATIKKGTYCVVSLEEEDNTGIRATGNGDINLGCGMITNSRSMSAAIATGSSDVTATPIAAVGDVQESENWNGAELLSYTVKQDDPFASKLPPAPPSVTPVTGQPTFAGCQGASNKFADNPSDTTNFVTGAVVHTAGSVQCFSQMKFKGTVTLAAATYVIDSGSVEFEATASVTCNGCTFVLTNSDTSSTAAIGSVIVTGTPHLDLHAATSGYYKDILFYQDRRAPDDGLNKILGDATSVFEGAFYFPTQELQLGGNATMTTTCGQFVAKTVDFVGNGGLTNTCPGGYGSKAIWGRHVRLVA